MSLYPDRGVSKTIDEMKIGSVSFDPNIQITAVLGARNITALAEGFRIVPTGYGIISPENFAQFLGSAFSLRESLDPSRIPYNNSTPSKVDTELADKLGYKVVPMASVGVSERGYLATWIGPTLVHKDSELAVPRDNNHLQIMNASKPHILRTVIGSNILLPEHMIATAHYMRINGPDEIMVLAEVAKIIGDQGINIFGAEQVINRENHIADIGFLLKPCPPKRVKNVTDSIASINGFSSRLKADSLFRIL